MPEAGGSNIEVARHLIAHKGSLHFVEHDRRGDRASPGRHRYCLEWISGSALDWTAGGAVRPVRQATGSSRGSRHGRQPVAFVQRIDGGRVAKGGDPGTKETK
jgi:hypothetical protein